MKISCSLSFALSLTHHMVFSVSVFQVHTGVVYECEYCDVYCYHAHTLRRHLYRRHTDRPEWHQDTFTYIKSRRQYRKPEAEGGGDLDPPAPENSRINLEEQDAAEKNGSAAVVAGQEEGRFVLAQIIGPGGAEGSQTQTVIIQGAPGSNLDENNLTPEIYEALKNLSARVGNPANSNIMVMNVDGGGGGDGRAVVAADANAAATALTNPANQLALNQPTDSLLLGTEGTDFSVGDQNVKNEEQYLNSQQTSDKLIEEITAAAAASSANVKSESGSNRIIVTDGQKQMEVDLPDFAKLKAEPSNEQTVIDQSLSGLFAVNDGSGNGMPSLTLGDGTQQQLLLAAAANTNPGQVIVSNSDNQVMQQTGDLLQSGQLQLQMQANNAATNQPQQHKEFLVHIDQNLDLNNGNISMEQMQALIQQQLLQQLQSQPHLISSADQVQMAANQVQVQLGGGAAEVQMAAANQVQQQLAGPGQVQLTSDEIQLSAEQMQQLGIAQQVPINPDQVPMQVQMLADQVLGTEDTLK